MAMENKRFPKKIIDELMLATQTLKKDLLQANRYAIMLLMCKFKVNLSASTDFNDSWLLVRINKQALI